MATLQWCKNVLWSYVLLSVYIATLWKRATISKPEIPDMQKFCQNEDGSNVWLDDTYLDDMLNIVFEEILRKEKIMMTKEKGKKRNIISSQLSPHTQLEFS